MVNFHSPEVLGRGSETQLPNSLQFSKLFNLALQGLNQCDPYMKKMNDVHMVTWGGHE